MITAAVLREHWLTGIECDHEARTDVATCFCARWRSEPQPSVIQAVERWIEHVQLQIEPLRVCSCGAVAPQPHYTDCPACDPPTACTPEGK